MPFWARSRSARLGFGGLWLILCDLRLVLAGLGWFKFVFVQLWTWPGPARPRIGWFLGSARFGGLRSTLLGCDGFRLVLLDLDWFRSALLDLN